MYENITPVDFPDDETYDDDEDDCGYEDDDEEEEEDEDEAGFGEIYDYDSITGEK